MESTPSFDGNTTLLFLSERMGVVVQQHGYGAACEAGFSGVGTAGEDRGNARAEHDAGELRAAEVLKLLGEHVAAFEIGHDQDVGLSGDGRNELLDVWRLSR